MIIILIEYSESYNHQRLLIAVFHVNLGCRFRLAFSSSYGDEIEPWDKWLRFYGPDVLTVTHPAV